MRLLYGPNEVEDQPLILTKEVKSSKLSLERTGPATNETLNLSTHYPEVLYVRTQISYNTNQLDQTFRTQSLPCQLPANWKNTNIRGVKKNFISLHHETLFVCNQIMNQRNCHQNTSTAVPLPAYPNGTPRRKQTYFQNVRLCLK